MRRCSIRQGRDQQRFRYDEDLLFVNAILYKRGLRRLVAGADSSCQMHTPALLVAAQRRQFGVRAPTGFAAASAQGLAGFINDRNLEMAGDGVPPQGQVMAATPCMGMDDGSLILATDVGSQDY